TTLWTLRTYGKYPFLAPEQFTREWDYHASRSLEDLQREPTAGQYHWWTNLFHVGWIMWSLMTHCYPPIPAQAAPYVYHAEDVRDFQGGGSSESGGRKGGGGVGSSAQQTKQQRQQPQRTQQPQGQSARAGGSSTAQSQKQPPHIPSGSSSRSSSSSVQRPPKQSGAPSSVQPLKQQQVQSDTGVGARAGVSGQHPKQAQKQGGRAGDGSKTSGAQPRFQKQQQPQQPQALSSKAQGKKPEQPHPQPASQPHQAPHTTKEDRIVYSGWTYGGNLTAQARYNRYDPMLRLCVQRCLDHEPASRPDMVYMQYSMDYFARKKHGESDGELRRAVERIFGGP
ncbi:hypothetical protein BD289DRAFT_244504, partial [Coniella lustricola]